MKYFFPTITLIATASILIAPSSWAEPLFSISATGGNGQPITQTGKSLLDLAETVVQNQGQYSSLIGLDVTISIPYAGVQNAITMHESADGKEADIHGLGKLNKTFTGVNRTDLKNQIIAWLKEGGDGQLADFYAEINKKSFAGIVDGNPSAQTGVMAQHAFDRWAGLQRNSLVAEQDGLYSSGAISYQDYTLDVFNSRLVMVDASIGYRFDESIALCNTFSGGYQDTESSKVGRIGDELALPITVYGERRMKFEVTPMVMIGGAASVDMANGGLFIGGGLAGHASFDVGYGFTLGGGAQYITYKGQPITYTSYHFETAVDQSVLSLGIDGDYRVTKKFHILASIAENRFLSAAAQDNWLSPTLAVHWGKATYVELGYQGVISNAVSGNGGYVRFGWNW